MFSAVIVLPLTLALFSISERASPQTPQINANTWTTKSGDFQIQVSAAEMKATRISNDQLLFSASALTRRGFGAYSETVKGDNVGQCKYSRTFRPISLVGNFLTFSDQLLSSCSSEAHPSSSYRVTTIDLSRGETPNYASSPDDPLVLGSRASKTIQYLQNLFNEQDIVHTMQQHSILKRNFPQFPTSLVEITKSIRGNGIELPNGRCRFTVSPDYLSRFILHSSMEAKVEVQLPLIPMTPIAACRNASGWLNMLLPMPDQLHTAFDSAGFLQNGFFPEDAPQVEAQIICFISTGCVKP